MRKLLLGFCIISVNISSFAQNDEVLMTIDGKPVYKSEFEYIFQKNNKDESVSKEDLDEYVDLFTKFKLKVTQAREMGLDTMPKLLGELKGYRTQLSRQYLTDNKLTDQLIEEGYNRMKKEVNASHILVKVPMGGDTLEAYNKAMKLYERASNGEDFAELARLNSEGPSGKNGGELGWFSGFRMIYRFESAAFNTKVGEISKPVRTRYGYHVIKVNDTRDARPDMKLSHILVHVKPDASAEDKAKAEKKINEIFDILNDENSNEGFKELVELYSDDKASVKKAGSLGWISKNNFFSEIVEAAYTISEDGGVSKPVKTNLGWHIIQRDNLKEIGSLEDNIAFIKSKIQRDERGSQGRKAKVNSLKVEYKFKLNEKAKSELFKVITNKNYGENFSNETAAKYTKVLFSFADTSFTQEAFLLNFFELNRAKPKQELKAYISRRLNGFVERKIMDYEKQNLENKYPEFRSLMQEYTDGVLLFELTDQMVWSKAIRDTSGLNSFYQSNKSDFMWNERADFDLYVTSSKKYAKKAYKMAKKGIQHDSIMNYINMDSELNMSYEGNLAEINKVEYFNGKKIEKSLYKPAEESGVYYVLNVKQILEKQPKKLSEAKGIITSRYQDYLESEWVNELQSKYSVEVNKEILYSLVK